MVLNANAFGEKDDIGNYQGGALTRLPLTVTQVAVI